MVEKELITPWYITGFCDGEASFTYSRTGTKGNLNIYFAIKLNNDDAKLLEEIKNFFGVGKIYPVKPIPPRRFSGHTRAASYYRVSKIAELEKIIAHFDKYPLRGRKLEIYNAWEKMVSLKKNFNVKIDLPRLRELAESLSGLSNKNTKLSMKKESLELV